MKRPAIGGWYGLQCNDGWLSSGSIEMLAVRHTGRIDVSGPS